MCEAKVIPVYNGSSDLLPVVLEETGGLGVDIVIDSGGEHILLCLNFCLVEHAYDCKNGHHIWQCALRLLNGTLDQPRTFSCVFVCLCVCSASPR